MAVFEKGKAEQKETVYKYYVGKDTLLLTLIIENVIIRAQINPKGGYIRVYRK